MLDGQHRDTRNEPFRFSAGSDKGAWGRPWAWEIQEAGRQIHGVVDGTPPEPEPEHDTFDLDKGGIESGREDTGGEGPDYEWEDEPVISGHRGDLTFETDGAVRVDLSSVTTGIDGLEFQVRWYGLDEAGSVVPNISAPPNFWTGDPTVQTYTGVAGFNTGQQHVLEPPFESPNGYRVEIWVRPGQTYSGNSAGVDMALTPVAGGRLDPASDGKTEK